MCAIYGIIDQTKKINIQSCLEDFKKSLIHRGPDAQNQWVKKDHGLGIGHCRLSIIDLDKRANQPFFEEDNMIISYNGEIYNYLEIKKNLIYKGYKFQTTSDTEVLIKAYKEWGKAVFNYIDGMFAFAIYDLNKKKVIIARDKSGEKPIFYYLKNQMFLFSSELLPIINLDFITKRINQHALNNYFSMGYTSNDESLIQDVHKLEKGSYLEIDLKNFNIEQNKYFEYGYENFVKTGWHRDDTYLIKIIKENLSMSCEKMINSDVPASILLSGGLDSSIITAIYSKVLNKKVNTFNISFEFDEKNLDSFYAQKIATHLNTNHSSIRVKFEDNENILEEIINKFNTEPFGDSSLIPSYLVYRELKKNYTVAIGGDGADELFGGYKHFQRSMYQGLFLLGIQSDSKWNYLKNKIENKFVRGIFSKKKSFPFEANYFSYLDRKKLFNDQNFVSREQILNIVKIKNKSFDLKNFLIYDYNYYLPNNILPKIDTASMMNSVEARSPFLSRDLVNISLMVDDKFKANFFERKILLRKIAKELLPNEFDFKRKQGFSIPISEYFNTKWKGYFLDTFNKSDVKEIYNTDTIRNLSLKNQKNLKYGEQMYLLLLFEKWRQKFNINIS